MSEISYIPSSPYLSGVEAIQIIDRRIEDIREEQAEDMFWGKATPIPSSVKRQIIAELKFVRQKIDQEAQMKARVFHEIQASREKNDE